MHMLVGYPPGALGGEPYGRKNVRLATKWDKFVQSGEGRDTPIEECAAGL
jgi:hypothetical protein